MTDTNEIEALKAACRGALGSTERLTEVNAKVAQLDPRGDIAPEDLEELSRVTLAHALAAQALRGFVETMRTRRGSGS